MLRGLAKSVLVGAVQKGTGVPQSGAISSTLITTGMSLLLIRGRRPVGLALVAAGGLLRWRELEQERRTAAKIVVRTPVPSVRTAAARAPR